MHEIEALPLEEQREVLSNLQAKIDRQSDKTPEITYADNADVMRIADRIFTERAELFKKLAQ